MNFKKYLYQPEQVKHKSNRNTNILREVKNSYCLYSILDNVDYSYVFKSYHCVISSSYMEIEQSEIALVVIFLKFFVFDHFFGSCCFISFMSYENYLHDPQYIWELFI